MAVNGFAANLPSQVSEQLKRFGIPLSAVSVEVRQVDTNRPILSVNADQLRNPASVMKLVTTASALELLGPTYQWKTDYLIDGKMVGDTLQGNIVMRGSGDPFLTVDRFWGHMLAIRERGIRDIRGNLIIDNTLFNLPPHDRAAFDGKPQRLYNVGPDAALTNFSATRFVLEPRGNGVNVFADPPLANLVVHNKLVAQGGKCVNRNAGWSMRQNARDGKLHVTFSGNYRTRCRVHSISRSLFSNNDYTYQLFRYLWESMGGTLSGGYRTGATPETASHLVAMPSRSLSENIASINKYSNNVMARQLLLTLGVATSDQLTADVRGAGVDATLQWMNSMGIDTSGISIENGSGLSRTSRISARQMNDLLAIVWNSTWRPEFLASFSLAALDGTMRKRLKKSPVAGRARIKTGLINGVRSMAGYVHSQSGEHFLVTMMIDSNKVNYWNGNLVQDAILEWIYNR